MSRKGRRNPEVPQGAWRTLLKSVFTIDLGQIEVGGAIRCTIGVVVPIVVGIAAGAVADGVAAAVGALSVGFASFQGGYRARASLTVLVGVGMAVSTVVGALATRNAVSAILVTAVWGGIAGMMVSLGQGGLVTGLQWVVAELVVGTIPMTLGQAAVRAAMVLAGGIIQTVLVVALWPFRTYRFERRAIRAAYLDLAILAANIRSGEVLSRGAITLNDARQTLEDPQPFSRTGQLLAFQALVDEAERIRIELTAIARHRSRVEDEAVLEALDKLTADIADALRTVGKAAGHDDDPRLGASFAADLARDCASLEQIIRVSEVPEWLAAELTAVANAVSGQLRSAAHVALVSSGMPEANRFSGSELPRRRSTPIRTPLETLSANVSWQSAAFRHAVRMATALAAASVIYRESGLQHGYWLPLTVLVVLRADFTSTAVRGLSRILGTIAGAALATLLAALLRPDDTVLTVLFTISVLASYVVVRANYTLFSISVTAYVVFLLAFVKLPELAAVTYRLTSTVLGGALAIVAYLLWPTWESRLIGPQLAELLDAQADYSGAVLAVFADPQGADRRRLGELRSIARRARSNAEASLERMASEPARATRDAPLSLGKATSVLAAARRFAFGVLTLHSDLPPSDFPACREVEPFARGIGSMTRGNAALLRTLTPLARIQQLADSRPPDQVGEGGEPSRGSGDRGPIRGAVPAGGVGNGAQGGGGGGATREGGDGNDPAGTGKGGTWRNLHEQGSAGSRPPTLRELHGRMARELEPREDQDGHAGALISLLVGETDFMVDSVNTVAEVLGRVESVPTVGTGSNGS